MSSTVIRVPRMTGLPIITLGPLLDLVLPTHALHPVEVDPAIMSDQATAYQPQPVYSRLVKERIHKLLAHAGVASRRAVEEMVRQGRVSASTARCRTELPILVDPAKDAVRGRRRADPVQGQPPGPSRPADRVYWIC